MKMLVKYHNVYSKNRKTTETRNVLNKVTLNILPKISPKKKVMVSPDKFILHITMLNTFPDFHEIS